MTHLDPQLNLDLFARNLLPFAAYFEHAPWRIVEHARNLQERTYYKRLPLTSAIAADLLRTTALFQLWGLQHDKISWVTVTAEKYTELQPAVYEMDTAGELVRDKDGVPILRRRALGKVGSSLRALDLIKHLTGRTLAVGITDQCRNTAIDWSEGRRDIDYFYNGVESLKIDTDMDEAWAARNHGTVFAELRNQRRVANLLGFPYFAFRTGGRGIQGVVAIPHVIWMSAASWICLAFRLLADIDKQEGAKIDRDSLWSIMRLPGGIHRTSRDLGLWIDIDGELLYEIGDQALLMKDAYRFNLAESRSKLNFGWSEGEFVTAAQEIADWLDERGHEPYYRITDIKLFYSVAAQLPSNLIVERFIKAAGEISPKLLKERQDQASQLPVGRLPTSSTSNASPLLVGSQEIDQPPTHNLNLVGAEVGNFEAAVSSIDLRITREQAELIWQTGYNRGKAYEWHLTYHGNGLLVATILFGPDHALEQLLVKARATPSNNLSERLDYIQSMWAAFSLKHWTAFRPPLVEPKMDHKPLAVDPLTSEQQVVSAWVVDQANLSKKMSKPSRVRLSMVADILIGLFANSPDGQIQVSAGSIAAEINKRYPDQHVGRSTVDELLKRITEGNLNAAAILKKVEGVYGYGGIFANVYSAGSLLVESTFGKELEQRRNKINIIDDGDVQVLPKLE